MPFSISSLQSAQLQQVNRSAQTTSASLEVNPSEVKASLQTNTLNADLFVATVGSQQRPHPRLDPSRFPNASSPDSMKWVDHGKPGLDTGAYERLKQAISTMELPPGFDVVVLGPSRAWPNPAVELAVKLPNGAWEQNAFVPKDGKLTQVSNLDEAALARRPPDLRGALSAAIAFDEGAKPTTAAELLISPNKTEATLKVDTSQSAAVGDLSKVNTRIPVRPEVDAAVTELRYKGFDVELLGASSRKGDKYENFELVVDGKQGTYLYDNGLFVNRDNDGERLNGRSAALEQQLHSEHAAKQQERQQQREVNRQNRQNINNRHESIAFDGDE